MNIATPSIAEAEAPGTRRRELPRVEIDSRAAVRTREGKAISARACNVSPRGALLRLDRGAAQVLRPDGRPIKPLSDERVTVCLELPIIGGTTRMTVVCRLAHFRMASDGNVLFGVEFKLFQADGLARLWRFITDSMTPIEAA